jgi:hypothetical protein
MALLESEVRNVEFIDKVMDWGRQIFGLKATMNIQPPTEKVFYTYDSKPDDTGDRAASQAQILHSLRPEVPLGDFEKQVRNPIASRMIAVYVEIDLPQLGRSMVFDTRVDNPNGMPPSLNQLPQSGDGSPWPRPPKQAKGINRFGYVETKGHGGSSCPGYLSKFALNQSGNNLEIPVEILAFHVEGENDACGYSICMYSEVLGRVTYNVDAAAAYLNMWGKMMITLRPHNPAEFGGHDVIQMVSRDYVRQQGSITGFPPKNTGEYISSAGGEVYVGVNPGQRHLQAIVREGRIIFSTDIDEFLQARTRISAFTLLDKAGNVLDPGPAPYDPGLIGKIAGVRFSWDEVRSRENGVTHYRCYRLDPDEPQNLILLSDKITETSFTDWGYDGTRSFAYAIVPAFVDQIGMEVQGVSLDHGMIMALEPKADVFKFRNHGVGHVRWMK